MIQLNVLYVEHRRCGRMRRVVKEKENRGKEERKHDLMVGASGWMEIALMKCETFAGKKNLLVFIGENKFHFN